MLINFETLHRMAKSREIVHVWRLQGTQKTTGITEWFALSARPVCLEQHMTAVCLKASSSAERLRNIWFQRAQPSRATQQAPPRDWAFVSVLFSLPPIDVAPRKGISSNSFN